MSQCNSVLTGYGSDVLSEPVLEEWATSDNEDEQNPGNHLQPPHHSAHHVRQDLAKNAQKACLEQALADIEGFLQLSET